MCSYGLWSEFKRYSRQQENSYISDRTARILKKFDYTEFPMLMS